MKVSSVTTPVPLHPCQDPPTLHNGLRMKKNHRRTPRLGQMFPSHGNNEAYEGAV
ncbi:MAG: hypothetical protein OEZ52_05555 [Candidatus Aminicenantes bacterium]|nr:hypothetical protein [Candidatus Aminicenantes bacterium]MDH5742986.1 hypothetical protein [Candidatus Aminicenantes bacterium]